MLIDSSINNFYNQSSEDTRLLTGLGPLEFLRNKQLISRYLPVQNAVIADIGGGTGHYSSWLADLGYNVILIDPVAKHIQQAEKRAKKSRRKFKCILGEARQLPIEANSIDLAILHGPLYHLQEQEQRLAALKEVGRTLKIGGTAVGFAITHAASTLAALQNGMLHHPEVYQMCRQELQCGAHEPPTAFPGMLPQAFFHRPNQLIQEFEEAGFKIRGLYAVEGMAWLDAKYFESWATAEKQGRLLDLIEATESDPDLLCLSPHMMIAAEPDHEV